MRLLLSFLLLSTHAALFTADDVAKAYVNPKYCNVMKSGDLECNHVRVVLKWVSVEGLKDEGKQ